MDDAILIVQGGIPNRQPVGYFRRQDGQAEPYYSLDAVELSRAAMLAIGLQPLPPTLDLGGSFSISAVSSNTGGSVTDTQGMDADTQNTAAINLYHEQMAAWLAHADQVNQNVKLLLGKTQIKKGE